ncbi:secretin N-terminal domain-containing protein, partial [Zavarzinella formosa]|uniref:secretin N-terminal domain-containing protein n=1 Tax=Zavarzinella formosa TaxID=360055 RepID=UPI0004964CFD
MTDIRRVSYNPGDPGEAPPRLIAPPTFGGQNYLAQVQPGQQPPLGTVPPKTGPGGLELISPRSPVFVDPLDELGAIIITANNQADLDLVLKVIGQLKEFLLKEGRNAGPKMRILQMEHADAVEIVYIMNQVFARARGLTAPQQQQGGLGGVNAQQQLAASNSIYMLPLGRSNSILILAPELRLDYYIEEIKKLDKPNAGNALRPFPLKKASSQQVATLITQFYNTRYTGETNATNLVRVSYDTSSNTVFVQASPADMEDIKSLIERLDTSESASTNELRIVRLRNAIADELASILQQALTQGILPQGTGFVQTPGVNAGGAGGAGFGGGGAGIGGGQGGFGG